MFNITQYLERVESAIDIRNGDLASAYLSYRHEHGRNSKLRIYNPESLCSKTIGKPWDEVTAFHLKCISALQLGDVIVAFHHQHALVQCLVKIFQAAKGLNWTWKVVQVACLELRLLAAPADKAACNQKNPVDCMEKTAESLMACFRICAADKYEKELRAVARVCRPLCQGDRQTLATALIPIAYVPHLDPGIYRSDNPTMLKKWGMLMLANQMFKVYFKINRHHLCKPLVRAIDSFPQKDKFPLAQRITYKFYTGQRALFDGDYKNADECLSFCFENCHVNSPKNKRSVLLYLIPVKMILGLMPKPSLLTKYGLENFNGLVTAVKEGNLARFSQIIDQNRAFLIKHSIYIIMQRLSTVTTRNLLKKVYHIVGSHQIPVEMFLKALLIARVDDATWEEAECLIANLIAEGVVKGYISSQHDMLVVSKTNPFPPLSSVK